MLNKPHFNYAYHVELVEPHHVFLMSETKHFVLSGPAYTVLAPLIDGKRTTNEIVAIAGRKLPLPEVFSTLRLMERKGYIVEADDSIAPEAAGFWNSLDLTTTAVASRLADSQVAVTALGGVQASEFTTALQQLGIGVGQAGRFGVVLTDDYLNQELDAYNRQALAANQSWMLIKPVGTVIWIGPIFQPGATGCWECLAQRLKANRQVESFVLERSRSKLSIKTAPAGLPSTTQVALQLAATEVAKSLALGGDSQLQGSMISFNLLSLSTHTHTLVRRPQCPACGTALAPDRSPQPPQLRDRAKIFTADGGHRTATPEETFERYKQHISPITGVISTLMSLSSNENSLAYSYAAGHNFAMLTNSLYVLRQNMRSRSGGKGVTDIQAKVSAICEGIERYSGVMRGDEIRRRASYQELGTDAIHPNACMRFSDQQYEQRHAWNAQCADNHFHIVPEPFDEDRAVEWSPVWSLTNRQFKYLPTAYCYYGHHELTDYFFAMCDANGCASGNTLEEAILQAFMELVERDSVAIWWYNRLPQPAVDLDSFQEPYFHQLKRYYREHLQRDLWVLDITSDLSIPAFAAVSRRVDRPVEDIVLGFGAHLDPKLAILRALTEANQFLPGVSRTAPDGSTDYWFDDQDTIKWWKTATVSNQPYVAPDQHAKPRTRADYPQLSSDNLLEDVHTCVAIAQRHGLETLVLDQTRPDIGLSVARVVVPGLRHFWRRLGPGRLYDVPLKLGRLKQPLSEEQLNPISVFF
jgi:bacteriocin biosynthesis cyclodehydratase domain-containing protein